MNLTANLERIRQTIPNHVTLVAVTKNRPTRAVIEMLRARVNVIAENRIQEALKKFPQLPSPKELPHKRHFIGHLQTNKAKDAVALFDMIESVDSLKLVEKLNAEAGKQHKILPILLQINVSQDPDKYGFSANDLSTVIIKIKKLPHLNVRGLMTIGKFHDNPEDARSDFRHLKQLCTTHNLPECSMGMSHDYKVAIEEGATMVRLGTILFEGNKE